VLAGRYNGGPMSDGPRTVEGGAPGSGPGLTAEAAEAVEAVEDDSATLGALGVGAYVLAAVGHEVIGHGGTCLARGGTITLLTSVYFQCRPGGDPLTALAGPAANLLAGGLFWAALRWRRGWTPATRLFLLMAMAFNLFWGTGYMIYSGLLNLGDWIFALRDFDPGWGLRSLLVLAGLAAYRLAIRAVAAGLAPFVSADDIGRSRLRRLLLIPYLAAGVAACVAAVLFPGDRLASLKEGGLEIFAASLGLVELAWSARVPRMAAPSAIAAIPRKPVLILVVAAAFVAFSVIINRPFGPL
jgi:hypothetical protein